MFGMAVGEMGIAPSEFWRMTPSEFMDARIMFVDNQTFDFRQEWLRARMIAYYSGLGNLRKGTAEIDIRKFPWETKGIKPIELIGKKDILAQTFPKTLNAKQ